jgi:hypothetical protein
MSYSGALFPVLMPLSSPDTSLPSTASMSSSDVVYAESQPIDGIPAAVRNELTREEMEFYQRAYEVIPYAVQKRAHEVLAKKTDTKGVIDKK